MFYLQNIKKISFGKSLFFVVIECFETEKGNFCEITSCLILSALERTKALLLICLIKKDLCLQSICILKLFLSLEVHRREKYCLDHLRCIFSDFESSLHTTSFISAPLDLNKNH